MPYNPAAENYAIVRDSLIGTLKGTATFQGRSRRRDVWIYYVTCILFGNLLAALAGLSLPRFYEDWLDATTALLFQVPTPALLTRRIRDVGISGWWAMVYLLPLVETLAPMVDTGLGQNLEAVMTSPPWTYITGLVVVVGGLVIMLVPSKPD